MKKKFMLPCIAAVAIATFVGTKSLKSNANDNNSLLMANVEALSSGSDCGVDWDCYIDKDECVLKAETQAQLTILKKKFSLGNIQIGYTFDRTNQTKVYKKLTEKMKKDGVAGCRCLKDVTCSDLKKSIGWPGA